MTLLNDLDPEKQQGKRLAVLLGGSLRGFYRKPPPGWLTPLYALLCVGAFLLAKYLWGQ